MWYGRLTFSQAIYDQRLESDSTPALIRTFPRWCALSPAAKGVVDFAFAGVTPEHLVTGLARREFADSVHTGLFVGWLHKAVALVAERKVGPCKLLISTFRLREHLQTNPVAARMFHDLLIYLIRLQKSIR